MASHSPDPHPSARQRLLERVRADCPRLADDIARRAVAEIPDYGGTAAADLVPVTSAMLRQILDALSEQRDPSAAELTAFAEYGRLRAHQRISLEGVLRAWRMSIRRLLEEFDSVATDSGSDDHLLLGLTRETLDLVDSAILAFSTGHREVELERAGRDRQDRADFTRALLLGTLTATDLRQRAPAYGLDVDHDYRAFRTHATADLFPADLVRHLRPFSLTTIDGDLAGITDRTPEFAVPFALAFGPPARPQRLDHSFRLASRTLTTARTFGLTGPHDFDDLGLLPAVLADPDLGAELARRYLTPLGHGDAATILTDTVECYLDTGLRIDATAQRLIVHPNTVRYRIGRFEHLTGSDLRRAHIGAEVWWAIHYRKANPG
ncbi:PucR family transcriptional regulator [Nocardia sp. NPDC059240]|uniref:PucR family transcriptional regulator n=1 Tax=Nocardia sp. NPDC059240 TaxID=3346786 RepID=UPI00369CF3B1